MTREQMDRFVALARASSVHPSEIFIHPDGEPEVLKPTDPPFFSRVLSARARVDRLPPANAGARRRTIPAAVRREVLNRDGPWCYLCDSRVLLDGLHFDHIIPVSRGGSNEASNIGVSCAACNLSKGDGLTSKRPRALR